jgi:hypothetical protein
MDAQADRDPFLSMKPIPQSGATVQSFVPEYWNIESRVDGDLDGNGTLDSVIVIWDTTKKNVAEEVEASNALGSDGSLQDGNRGLLVLLKGTDGRYKLAGFGKNTLLCLRCYGMMFNPGGGEPDIKIKDHVIIINQFSFDDENAGARSDTFRFRYEKVQNRIRLIGADFDYTIRPECAREVTSINYLTNTKITRSTVCKVNPKGPSDSTRKEKIDPTVWYLENYIYLRNDE